MEATRSLMSTLSEHGQLAWAADRYITGRTSVALSVLGTVFDNNRPTGVTRPRPTFSNPWATGDPTECSQALLSLWSSM